MDLLILYVVLCIVPALVAWGKRRSGFGFFLLSLVLSPVLGLAIALIINPGEHREEPPKSEHLQALEEATGPTWVWVLAIAAIIVIGFVAVLSK